MEKYLNLIRLNTSLIYIALNNLVDGGVLPIFIWCLTTVLCLYCYNKK